MIFSEDLTNLIRVNDFQIIGYIARLLFGRKEIFGFGSRFNRGFSHSWSLANVVLNLFSY